MAGEAEDSARVAEGGADGRVEHDSIGPRGDLQPRRGGLLPQRFQPVIQRLGSGGASVQPQPHVCGDRGQGVGLDEDP
jgi:hypothetical protein